MGLNTSTIIGLTETAVNFYRKALNTFTLFTEDFLVAEEGFETPTRGLRFH